MAKPAPLSCPQDPNIPSHARITRSTSHLSKQLVPDEDDTLTSDDHEMDQIVLAPLPSATTASQGPDLSSETRRELARAGSSALDERVDELEEDGTAAQEDDDAAVQSLEEEKEAMDGEEEAPHQDEMMESSEEDFADEDEEEEAEEEEDEEMDDSRSEGELQQIEYEMMQLEQSVPQIVDKYKLVDRLGEGTFSSVYKALDIQHWAFDNSQWQPKENKGQVYVALKRIYVTSSPIRIHNELEILNDLRGASNVAYLIDAIRHEDQVLAVMPFNRHQDFRTYYRNATLPLLRSYFSCLFRALAATHHLQIIHRDVKPANFLYDVTTGQGILCDYGLAQKIGGDEFFEWKSDCLHSLPGPSWGGLSGRMLSQMRMEKAPGCCPGLDSGLHGVRLAKPLSLWEQITKQEQEWQKLEIAMWAREDNGEDVLAEEWNELERAKPWMMPPGWRDDIKGRMKDRQAFYKSWRPAKLSSSVTANQRAGYLKEDRRPSVRANRAGTRGFRAPEVLLKCPDQTVALDVWSAGVILLCFLTRRFPFFNSNDDTEALAEIAAIFGKKKMERCAALHNRTFVTNVPDFDSPPHPTLHALVKALNPPIIVENSPNPYGPIPSAPEDDAKWYQDSDMYQAVDLLRRCFELDCTKRWTAEECLEHPFFKGTYDLGLGRTEERNDGK